MLRKISLGVAGLLSLVALLVSIEFATGPIRLDDLRAGYLIQRQGPRHPATTKQVYKQTPTRPLFMHVFEAKPGKRTIEENGASVMLVHGGGFHSGWPEEFFPVAAALALDGQAVFIPEYRLQRRDGANYADELEDVADALEWVSAHAASYGGDPAKIVLGGSSAGAHLAAALVTLGHPGARALPEILGLVLTSPYLNSTDRSGRAESRASESGLITRMWVEPLPDVFEGRSADYSPRAHLRAGLPPAHLIGGAEDPLWPPAVEFCEAMARAGNRCTTRPFPGAGHAFSLEGQADHAAVVEEIRSSVRRFSQRG